MKALVAAFLLCAGLLAQQARGPLTNQRVMGLVADGVSQQEIIRIINTAPEVDFVLRPDATDALMKAGATEETIKAMAAREGGIASTPNLNTTIEPIAQPTAAPGAKADTVGQPISRGLAAGKLSAQDVQAAIVQGAKFKSRDQYLQKGLTKVQLASAWASDGISKYVTFFTDCDAIAAASAAATQQMRELTQPEINALPLSGLLYANVQVHGRGTIPTAKVARRYSGDRAHLVLEIDGQVLQPIVKQNLGVRDASWQAPVALFAWYDFGRVSLLTGGQLGFDGARAELEFAFDLTPEQLRQNATVILIDGDGHRHKGDIDLAGLR